jgi:hypothetical protein
MTAASGERRVRSHPAVRTLLLTRGELSAWLLDERTGLGQQLNTSAAAVWALMEEPVTVEQLTADLAATFGVDDAIARTTVAGAIEMFLGADLVVRDDVEVGDDDGDRVDDGPVGDDDRCPVPALTRAPDP